MKKKHIIWSIILVIIVGAAVYFLMVSKVEAPIDHLGAAQPARSFDPQNATYMIDGQSVTLVNGVSEVPAAPGSASKVTTRYFGNEARGDLNGDGQTDIAYLITQDGGGSGTFFYAVAAIKAGDTYKLTNTFLIGDRIAPQTTEIISRELRVNYAERRKGEPMSAQPSQGATLLLKVTPDGVLEGLMK